MDKDNFRVGVLCGAIVVICLLLSVTVGCFYDNQRLTATFQSCLGKGGSWIPAGDGRSLCLQLKEP